MTTDNEVPNSHVVVEFHSSSTKGGQEAYKLVVDERATEAEADRVMALALRLRAEAKKALETPADLVPVFAESIEKAREKKSPEVSAEEAIAEARAVKPWRQEGPPVCDRCGKRHPTPWQHEGDCENCKERPVVDKPGAVWCEECTAERARRVDEALEEMK